MPNIIKLKRSVTAGRVPTTLQDGELMINQTDKLLFYKDNLGVIRSFDLAAVAGTSSTKWFDYMIGADSNSLNTQIATGYVMNYVYGTVTRFRLQPTGTEPDAFYSTFTSGVLSGLLAKKPQQL